MIELLVERRSWWRGGEGRGGEEVVEGEGIVTCDG